MKQVYTFDFESLKGKCRGFEEVSKEFIKHSEVETILPIRGSKGSAGYDFYSKETVTIQPNESHLFWTDVCAYMQENEVLMIYPRSSIGVKKGLMLKNTAGVIDSDFYPFSIGICLHNFSSEPVTIECGERIGQGIFQQYLTTDNDTLLNQERTGGFGSTNK